VVGRHGLREVEDGASAQISGFDEVEADYYKGFGSLSAYCELYTAERDT
jgi:hypothetical protein